MHIASLSRAIYTTYLSEQRMGFNRYTIHYANAILNFSESYKEVIAIGVNGYGYIPFVCKVENIMIDKNDRQ